MVQAAWGSGMEERVECGSWEKRSEEAGLTGEKDLPREV